MLIAPTLTADQFKQVHNALCNLDTVLSKLSGVVADQISAQLNEAIEDIRGALVDAYSQEDAAYNARYTHYDDQKVLNGIKHSQWSMYEVTDMTAPHSYSGADRVVYKDNWGKPVSVSIRGNTWAALWRAADECISTSGDNHHVFIEAFRVDPKDCRTLILHTGS